MSVTYHDFEVEISSNATGGRQQYFGKVIKSPAGEAPRCKVDFSFSAPDALAKLRADLENAVLDIDDKNRHGLPSRSEKILQDFGREVFRSVFVNVSSIQNIYARSKGAAEDLRIKLRIESPELAGLPWEYLYDENEVPRYVSLRRPVVRYLETEGDARQMGVKGPLRILGMIADPATDDWPKLDVTRERERINKGIDRLQHEGRVDFQWVSGGTGKDLMTKLLEDDWHIFHFIGHGGVEEIPSQEDVNGNGVDERGFIVMVDEDGAPVKKFASDLAAMLVQARKSLRLVLLNCCESAKINVGEKFGNPAIGLMRSGWLPAVVAMQFPISDAAAISMAEGFYRALARNRPVDDALTVARGFIQSHSSIEWGIPVLYMRSADGKLFEVDNPIADSAAAETTTKLSSETLQQHRQEFVAAAAAPPTSADGLEQLAQRGRALLAKLNDDLELAESVAKIYVDLGGVQQRNKQTPKAAASFGAAVTLAPGNAAYRVRRANFNALVGFYEKAIVDIDAAIKLQPDNPEFHWIKGVICSVASGPENKRGFLEEAIKSFTAAISGNLREPKYLVSRANTRAQTKAFAEALDDMDQAIALAPDNMEYVAQRAKIEGQMK